MKCPPPYFEPPVNLKPTLRADRFYDWRHQLKKKLSSAFAETNRFTVYHEVDAVHARSCK